MGTGIFMCVQQEQQQQQQQAQQLQQEQSAAQQEQLQLQIQADAEKQDKQLENNVVVAEIRAAGFGAIVDINENEMSDYQDSLKDIRQTQQYQDQTSFQREKLSSENLRGSQKMNLEQQKLQVQKEIADKQLEIARVNKNKFDKPSNDKKKK